LRAQMTSDVQVSTSELYTAVIRLPININLN
jgi:hypothetical protein